MEKLNSLNWNMMYQSDRGKRIMPPRENWLWEGKVSKNTKIKLFFEEYHGVNCSLSSPRPHYSARPKRPGHVAQASWIRRRSELTEKAWENSVQGLGKTVPRCSTRSMQMPGLIHSNVTGYSNKTSF